MLATSPVNQILVTFQGCSKMDRYAITSQSMLAFRFDHNSPVALVTDEFALFVFITCTETVPHLIDSVSFQKTLNRIALWR